MSIITSILDLWFKNLPFMFLLDGSLAVAVFAESYIMHLYCECGNVCDECCNCFAARFVPHRVPLVLISLGNFCLALYHIRSITDFQINLYIALVVLYFTRILLVAICNMQ